MALLHGRTAVATVALSVLANSNRGSGPFIRFPTLRRPVGKALLVIAIFVHALASTGGPARATVTFLNAWGSFGSGAGQFDAPQGLAVAPSGQVYVADFVNHRIQRFDATGSYETQWGSLGSAPGQFNQTTAVAVSSTGQVYVADRENDRIQRFDADGGFETQWGSSGSATGEFRDIFGVAVAPSGQVYVTDYLNQRIQRFDADGGFVDMWGSDGNAAGEFIFPYGVAVAATGQVYVVDQQVRRVQRFSAAGGFEIMWGSQGSAAGEFRNPEGVAVGPTGRVYVADKVNDRIQRFDAEGGFETQWGTSGSAAGELDQPSGVAVAPTGLVYVADTRNDRIQRFFDPDGWAYGTNYFVNGSVGPTSVEIGPGQIMGTSLTLDASKELVVSDTTSILPGGKLTLAGGTLTTQNFNVAGGVFDFQSGTLAFTDTLVVGNGPLGSSVTIQDGQVVSADSFAVVDVGASLTVRPGGTVSAATVQNFGDIRLDGNGAKIEAAGIFFNDAQLSGAGRIEGQFVNQSFGEVFIGFGDEIRVTRFNNSNEGRITLSGGTLRFDEDFTNTPNGLVIGNGTLRAQGGISNSNVMAFSAVTNVIGDVTNNGLITSSGGTTTFFDDVQNQGQIRTNQNSFTVYFGSYSGNGDEGTGTVIVEGDLQPGSSPGTMHFAGDLSLGRDATVEIEINGPDPGVDFDQILVDGTLSLDGTLNITLGYAPSPDDTFDFLVAGSVVGAFDNVDSRVETADGEGTFLFSSDGSSITLSGFLTTLPGDYNRDGIVDGADYTVWRDNLGSNATLPGDTTPGADTSADYDVWRSNFGSTSSALKVSRAAVPEPNGLLLLGLGALLITVARRSQNWRRSRHPPSVRNCRSRRRSTS